MSGEFQTYLIRSLLSEGRIRYETVMKTSEGGEAVPHRARGAYRPDSNHDGAPVAQRETRQDYCP
jgi:hypothetical protein